MSSHTRLRAAVLAAMVTLAAGGCSEAPPPAPEVADLPDLRREKLPKPMIKELLDLRRSLVKYHSFERAMRAGFDTKLTECMVMPPQGGMGFHYGNAAIIDSIPDPKAPEVLLYQPKKGGKLVLVGVEFIVPFTAWTKPDPPVLYGQVMRPNYTFGLWTLHIWLFKHNPEGLFADWNPKVRC